MDSIFSPVRRVAYEVEAARVGQRTDYDKLTLDITTDGSVEPKDALAEAAEILIRQLAIFTDLERIEGFGEARGRRRVPAPRRRSRTGWRTSRSRSSSSASARTTASSASGSRRSATS